MTTDHTALTDQLADALVGRVILPTEEGYDRARSGFYGGFDAHPAVVVQPVDAADVATVVNIARTTGVELSIRGGGHSPAGHSTTNGGILIDLSAMKGLEIDLESQTAWAQTGLTAGEYTAAVGAHGLATGFGDTGTVGIGGITLGGGVGFLSRKFGLTIDAVVAAEIVTADGQILEIDEDRHPDLFWAIRGGGGNFGVVTRLRYRLHPVREILGGMLIHPATPEVVAGLASEGLAAPDELSTIVGVMTAPPFPFIPSELHGTLMVMTLLAYAGTGEQAELAVDRLRSVAEPLFDGVEQMPYPGLFEEEPGDEADGFHPMAHIHSMFVDDIDLETAGRIIEEIVLAPFPMAVVQFRNLGGAIARIPDDATAYAHRQERYMVNVAAMYMDPNDASPSRAWVSGVADLLARDDNPAAYVNFLDATPGRVRDAYPGSTWDRLVAAKRMYDPENLFRANHNIDPQEG